MKQKISITLARILTLILSLTLIVGIGIAAFLLWSNFAPASASTSAPLIEFRSIESGEVVSIAVAIRGEHLTRAELWSDNQMIARETNPHPDLSNSWTVAWQWTPPGAGVFPLAARAFDESGRYGATTLVEVVMPPRGRLLFSSNRSGKYSLYSLAINSRETTLFSSSEDRQPSVSHSQMVAYARNQSGAWHIFTNALVPTQPTDLTPDLISAQRPAWSADGQHLAFEVTLTNTTNIFVTDARGNNRAQITHGDSYDGQASFSPSGDRLAFAAQQGGQWDIYTVNLDGSNLTRLTNDAAQDLQPAWSPDGNRIAFTSNRSGISQIYLIASNGSGDATRLTNFPSGAEQAVWSSDGNWLAFVAYTGDAAGDNRREIYLMYVPKDQTPREGRGLIRLTQNVYDDTEPAWVK